MIGFIFWLVLSVILFCVFVYLIKYAIEKGEIYKHDELELLISAVVLSLILPLGILALILLGVRLGLEKITEWDFFEDDQE